MTRASIPPRQLHVELRELRMFAEVVRRGGFSRAAEAVHATQPTVSKAIGRLEAEVGLPLLERHARGVTLTKAGEMVYRRARAMLAQRELLSQEVHAAGSKARGTLRLGFSRLETSAFFGRALAEFCARHPEIDLSVCTESDAELVQRLLRGELDVAGLISPREPRIETLELRRDPLMVVLPRAHALADRGQLSIRDLEGEALVLFEEKCPVNEMVLQAFDRAGITPSVAMKTSQVGLLLELVAEQLGIAFLPRTLVMQRPHPRLRAVPLRGFERHWNFCLGWSGDMALSQAARCWIALVRELHEEPAPLAEVA